MYILMKFLVEYDAIIFDLDGTLWNACNTCAKAWNNGIKHCGINFRTIEDEDIKKVAGKPYDVCVKEIFNNLDDNLIYPLKETIEKETNKLLEENGGILYDGVKEGIKELKKFYHLYIVSNCAKGYIENFLNYSKLNSTFDDFECWGNTGLDKCSNLKLIINRNHLQSPVYIGDTYGDYLAAKKAKIPFLHAGYGFDNVVWPNTFSSFITLVYYLLKIKSV